MIAAPDAVQAYVNGNYDLCLKLVEKYISTQPLDMAKAYALKGLALYKQGKPTMAFVDLNNSEFYAKNDADFVASFYAQAAYYALQNKEPIAIRYLRLAIEKGFNDKSKLTADVDFENIKKSAAFNDLLSKIK